MNRKAVLIFADPIGLDLARRGLPRFLQPLLSLHRSRASSIAADFHLFTSGKSLLLPGYQCHQQQGSTFAERLEAATEEIVRLGYEEIVLVGSDCPGLSSRDIATAFAELATKRLVLGPDHRGGCYLIGLHARERHLLTGVRWNCDTDLGQLISRVDPREITLLTPKQDIDSWADVRLLARAGHRLALVALQMLEPGRSAHDFFVDLCAQHARVRGQIPPPAFAF